MADDYGNFIGSSAPLLALGSRRNGSIEVAKDQDVFALSLVAGHSVTLEVSRLVPAASGGLTDPYIVLLDAAGRVLAEDDQGFGSGNARLHYSVPTTGTYYAAVFDYDSGIGTYAVGLYRRNIVPTSNFDDILTGTESPDTIQMGRGNDSARGNGGDDLLDGGEGRDTITYAGPAASYTIERVGVDGWSRTATIGFVVRNTVGTEGNDILVDVERIRFSDSRLALDLNGNAGITAKIIGAVFGKEAVKIKEYVGIGLAQLDGGTSRDNLIKLALDARFGGTPSATDLVNVLYTNVVGSAPPPGDLKYYTDLLNAGVYTQVSLAGLASDTDLNLGNIGFEALVNNGIAYV